MGETVRPYIDNQGKKGHEHRPRCRTLHKRTYCFVKHVACLILRGVAAVAFGAEWRHRQSHATNWCVQHGTAFDTCSVSFAGLHAGAIETIIHRDHGEPLSVWASRPDQDSIAPEQLLVEVDSDLSL